MKLEVLFPQLDQLVRNMGAKPILWEPTSESLDPLAELRIKLAERGIDVGPEEIDVEDGGLAYKGKRVVLYIRNTYCLIDDLKHNPEKTRRIHLAWCTTLEKMDGMGKLQRYVVTNRRDGLFVVQGYTNELREDFEEIDAKLMACKYCLKQLNYKGYRNSNRSEQKRIWYDFNIGEFLDEHDTHYKKKPTHTDKTAPDSGYTKNWSEISKKYRESARWHCEDPKCGVDLSNHKGLLQTHHLNGERSDNRVANLKAFCVLCHSRQPGHDRMHVKPMDELKIHQLRQEQKGY